MYGNSHLGRIVYPDQLLYRGILFFDRKEVVGSRKETKLRARKTRTV